MKLSTKQRSYLRGLAQTLRPQLHVGREGYTDGIRSALEDLFRGRELVKVRILNNSEAEPKAVAAALAEAAQADLVGVVGKTFVLYRPNPDLKERVNLPAGS
jgi:RNA-binding protein